MKYWFPSLLLGLAALSPLVAEEPPSDENYLGLNVWFLNDYGGSNALADIMQHARDWQNAAWNESVPTDADNWPLADCSTVVFGPGNHLGTYKLIFEGQAENISVEWTNGSVSNQQYDAETNTTTADVTLNEDSTGRMRFTGTRRQPTDAAGTGIKNVRLYRPGEPTDGSVILSSEFRALMSKVQVIRFMDWMSTNTNPLESWSHRRRPGQGNASTVTINGHEGDVGMPIEYMVAASNETGADMWINVPIFADEDYVTKLAQLIRYGSDGEQPYTSGAWDDPAKEFKGLNPDLKVYVEYANEIWNSAAGFRCFHWAKELSDAIRTDGVIDHPIEFDGEDDQWTLLSRYSAYRLVETSNLFRSVFGDAAMNTRVRPMLMGQIGGNFFNPRQLPWLEAYYSTHRPATDDFPNTDPKPVDYYMYGAGGSAYYGVNNWSADPEEFFAEGNYPEEGYEDTIARDSVRSLNYGLKRVAYEGGMGLDGGGDSMTEAERQTLNEDPRMRLLTEAYHDLWSRMGGDLLVYYVNTGPSRWEFTWDVDKLDTPKLEALDNLRGSSRAEVTLGAPIPGTAVARDQSEYSHRYGTFYNYELSGLPGIGGVGTGEFIALACHADEAGTATLHLRLASSSGSKSVSVLVNGEEEGQVTYSGQGNSTLVDTSSITVPVQKGLNVVRAEAITDGFNYYGIVFTDFEAAGDSQPTITTTTLPDATAGTSYSTILSAAGGDGDLEWTVASGDLPQGLDLDTGGTLSGTPAANE